MHIPIGKQQAPSKEIRTMKKHKIQIENMRTRTFGVEIEGNNIIRKKPPRRPPPSSGPAERIHRRQERLHTWRLGCPGQEWKFSGSGISGSD
jgi:hypothetical protein